VKVSRTSPLPLAVLVVLAAASLLGCPRKRPTAEDAGRAAEPSESSRDTAAADAAADVDIATGASQAWDAGPPVVTADTIDGAALRKRTHARLDRDTSPVTVLEGGSARALGERLCEAVVPRRPKDTPVLLKPNLGGFDWFKDPKVAGGDDGVRGRTTDPEFVRGVIRCLKARGHRTITIAEGWGAKHADWERLISVSGYAAMAAEEKVRLVAMDDDGVFDVEGDRPGKPLRPTGVEKTGVPTLLVPKILAEHLDHGLYLSLPKIKAHRFAVFSGAIKAMQGTVMLSDASPAFRQKWRTHRELGALLDKTPKGEHPDRAVYVGALQQFAERMVDVLELEAPDAVLAEGAPAVGGDGFQRLWPSAESVAIGGVNPVLVDRAIARLLGTFDNAALGRELQGHRTSPLLEVAAKRFSIDLGDGADAHVNGDGAFLIAPGATRPVHFVSMAGFSIHSDDAKPRIPGAPAPSPAPSASASTASSAGPPTSGKPTLIAKPIAADALAIDGVLEDAWRAATPVRFDTDWSGAKTGIATSVRARWSDRALYVSWELEGAGLHVDRTRDTKVEREKLYQEDCVELFLTPDPATPRRYFEIEIGPYGHWFDLLVDRTGAKAKSDVAWSSGAVIATTQDAAKQRAIVEAAFVGKDVVAALKAGAKLPFALYRMEGAKPRQYLAWSPTRTPKPDFHVPDAFGWLLLEAP
jgi:hypothetical protein